MGVLFGMEPPHISLKAETLFTLGPLVVTNSMLVMLIVMAVVLGFFAWVARNAQLLPSGRLQAVGEVVTEGLLGLVESVAGRDLGRRIFPLIGGLFIFILVANWSALLPGFSTIGFYEEAHHAAEDSHGAPAGKEALKDPAAKAAATATTSKENIVQKDAAAMKEAEYGAEHGVFVPFLRAANADLNMTIAMALIAVIWVQVIGVSFHGVGGYLKELATPWFLTPVHIISELARIISLSCRLFGNVFGGEVFLLVIFFLFPLFIPLIPLGLEVFFGFIQAVLFSVLTLVYLSLAAAGHGSHDEAHEHEHEPSAAHAAVAPAHGGD